MIAAFDVHYPAGGGASAAAVLFCDYTDETPSAEQIRSMHGDHRIPTLLGRVDRLAKEVFP